MDGRWYRYVHLTIPLQMALSHLLWWPTAERVFPVLPIVPVLDHCPTFICWIASSVLAISCILFATGRWTSRAFLPVALSATVVLCALDLNRVQVWLWLWVLCWVIDLYVLYIKRYPASLHAWVFIGVYVWGGLNKLTPWFSTNFDWLCEAFRLTAPLSGNTFFGYAAAIFEVSIGVFLVFPVTRTAGKWMAVVLHSYIIVVLSPLGNDWNRVIIPWNFAMIGLIGYFFQHRQPLERPTGLFPVAIMVLVWISPVLNFWSWWPESMSWKMYSNTQREATIYSEQGCSCAEIEPLWREKAIDNTRLLIDDWVYSELQVPAFNSKDNFRRAFQKIRRCSDAKMASEMKLEILTVGRWSREDRMLETEK